MHGPGFDRLSKISLTMYHVFESVGQPSWKARDATPTESQRLAKEASVLFPSGTLYDEAMRPGPAFAIAMQRKLALLSTAVANDFSDKVARQARIQQHINICQQALTEYIRFLAAQPPPSFAVSDALMHMRAQLSAC
jgi:hypothetical protein